MPKPLPILTLPNPLLRQRAAEVDADTLKGLRREGFFDDLVQTMRVEDGVGIAATQVGVPHRVFVALEGRAARVYVNPEITNSSKDRELDTEGCLSVPGKIGIVPRARSVTMRALNPDGKPVTRKAKGLVARIYQHEIDHLDGVLFIDRATRVADVPRTSRTARV